MENHESWGKRKDSEGQPFGLRPWTGISTNVAFRELRFSILIGISGRLRLCVDEQEFSVESGQILTITSMQMVEISAVDGEGWILDFSYDGFCRDEADRMLVYDNGLFCHFGLNQVLDLDPLAADRLGWILRRLEEEGRGDGWGAVQARHSLVKLVLVEAARAKLAKQAELLYRPETLMLRYLDLVRSSFEVRPSIGSLAKELGVSSAALDDACRRSTNESPQQLRDDLVVLEARRMLRYGGLSVKEVAAELGFADPLYFSRFFHKQTKTRPRDQLRRNLA